MSKSGLFAHFGSKEDLQLATIAAAREIFIAEVVDPARAAEPGLPRLATLIEAKLDYLRRGVFAGGCFFDAVRVRVRQPPARPGARRDPRRVRELVEARRRHGARGPARRPPRRDRRPEQVAFELDALCAAPNVGYQFDGDEALFDRARRAVRDRLDSLAAGR